MKIPGFPLSKSELENFEGFREKLKQGEEGRLSKDEYEKWQGFLNLIENDGLIDVTTDADGVLYRLKSDVAKIENWILLSHASAKEELCRERNWIIADGIILAGLAASFFSRARKKKKEKRDH